MKYAAIIEYVADVEKIQSLRPNHRQYLTQLRDRGQLAAAGPLTDCTGALIIYEAASAEEAERLIQGDPFHENGIFVTYVLRPWNPVIARREAFPA